ncbi:MAG: hypothetical protein CL566_05390 [Alphaproteobacteria bacterium]|nr:hypothetical protein [Alphaproteobacteria bacterium]|tara:strand:- start:637 stop:882 length:246 start_codon:yes stop_codon:yes gene_type:complete
MKGPVFLKTMLAKGLGIAAVAGALVLHAPNPASAQGADAAEVGKVIPHSLEVPDQNNQEQNFQGLSRKKGLILIFSRSLSW